MNRILLSRAERINKTSNLLGRQREAARLLALGMRNKDVAEHLGYHPQYITHLKRNPPVAAHMEKLARARDDSVRDIREDIKVGARNGLDFLLKVLAPGTPEHAQTDVKTKVSVAQDMLDREGSAPRVSRSNNDSRHVHMHVTADDIADLKRAVRGEQCAQQEVLDLPQRKSKGGELIPDDLLAQEPV